MAFPDSIDKLVTKLTELTEKGKVEWQETGSPTIYLAPVDKFTVTIGKGGPEAAGGYSFQIFERTGKAIDGVVAKSLSQLRNPDPDDLAIWDRLGELYEIARRRALHSEKVVSDLLASLDRIA